MFFKLLTLVTLGIAAREDNKEKEIWIGYPFIILVFGLLYRFFEGKEAFSWMEIFIAFGLIMYSVLFEKKFGLGDSLILSSLIPLCGINGFVRVFVEGMFFFMVKNKLLVKKSVRTDGGSEEAGEAFIPFVFISFVIWFLL